MSEGDGREEEYTLSDLDVRTVGLVRRGANRQLFYVVKSSPSPATEGSEAKIIKIDGGQTMSEDYKEVLAELETLEDFKDVTVEAWTKALAAIRGLSEDYAELKAKVADDEPTPPDPQEEEFAARLAQAEERFAEQLKAEREARMKVEEAFAAEQRARRLEQFNETAKGYGHLAGYEGFGEDLMRIADLDAEMFGRVDGLLKAASNAAEQAGLFSQQASATPVTVDGDPFSAEVERVRAEQFSDLDKAEGTVKAMEVVEKTRPELARRYAESL